MADWVELPPPFPTSILFGCLKDLEVSWEADREILSRPERVGELVGSLLAERIPGERIELFARMKGNVVPQAVRPIEPTDNDKASRFREISYVVNGNRIEFCFRLPERSLIDFQIEVLDYYQLIKKDYATISVYVPGFSRFESDRFRLVVDELGIDVCGLPLDKSSVIAMLMLSIPGSYDEDSPSYKLEESGLTSVDAIRRFAASGQLKVEATDDMTLWKENWTLLNDIVDVLQTEYGNKNEKRSPELEYPHRMISADLVEEAKANREM